MTRKQKKTLIRIIVSFVILAAEMVCFSFVEAAPWVQLIAYLVPYFVIGYDIVRKAVLGVAHLQFFDECFLMTIATVGAFVTGEYAEGTAVMLFYQVGELFQSCAVAKSRRSISELMDIRPDYANMENEQGELVWVSPEDVHPGDIITVKPGEKIPLDGIVAEGTSSADTSALTGESLPRDLAPGDGVISGCINLTGLIRVKVTKDFGSSTVSKILELVENSREKKSVSENFISSFSRVYTPAVVFGAIALAVIPPFFDGMDFMKWIYRAMTFLVISCPCALVISIPLSFFSGLGGAAKKGVLIKGSNYLESLAKAGIMVFDKTGTLTKGSFEVTKAVPQKGFTEDELLSYAALAESYSDHPIALSLKNACMKKIGSQDLSRLGEVSEKAGFGVSAVIDKKKVLAGNTKLMSAEKIHLPDSVRSGSTAVHIAVEGVYAGCILIADVIKEGTSAALKRLREMGVRKTVMLTGDSKETAQTVAGTLGIDEVHAELLPGDKVDVLEELLTKKLPGETLVFTGDGINDAPVLTRADIGIAMGAMGSDAAIEAADIVLMDDDPKRIADAIAISRKTLFIARQNTVFAIGVKLLVLLLGALGFANMWAAVFADVGVCVLAVLNAMRARG
ncbi:MAG: cadmium-translocating P-type ATPase [Ruminococcus sp.]|nr:cadmium-translocating P-type ATPase [Ruminococcus sp.]